MASQGTFCSIDFVDGFQDLRLLEMFYDRMESMDGNKDGKLNLSSVMSKEQLDGRVSQSIILLFYFGNACGYPERVAVPFWYMFLKAENRKKKKDLIPFCYVTSPGNALPLLCMCIFDNYFNFQTPVCPQSRQMRSKSH